MSDLVQVVTSLGVSELADTYTVGGMELLNEKLAASVLHLIQLQQARRRQHPFYRVLTQF